MVRICYISYQPMSLFPSDDELERVVVGPDSVAWRFGSDARLYLGPLGPRRPPDEIAHAA